jgi:Spy/CpxP family protein refolding chaperone
MNDVLTLTADQSTKIQAVNVKRMTEQQALREKMQGGGDREAMMTQMRALTEKYNGEYKAILTPEQYTKYEANMAQFRGGRGGQGGGQGGQGGGQNQR